MTTRHTIRYIAIHGRRLRVCQHLGEGLYLADDGGVPTLVGPDRDVLLRLNNRDVLSELSRLLDEA